MELTPMDSTAENVIMIIYCIIVPPGFWASLIYPYFFFRWKRKTKHKMQWKYSVISKWTLISFLLFAPIMISWHAYEQYCDTSIGHFTFPLLVIYVFLAMFVLYRFKVVKKHELLIPLGFWWPWVFLWVYKKRQTELMRLEALERGSDPC